jgi:hypothetical protein
MPHREIWRSGTKPVIIYRVALRERVSRNDQLINVNRLDGGGEAAAATGGGRGRHILDSLTLQLRAVKSFVFFLTIHCQLLAVLQPRMR